MEEALRADLREILGSSCRPVPDALIRIGKGYDPGMVREVVPGSARRNRTSRRWPLFRRCASRSPRKAGGNTGGACPPAAAAIDWDKTIAMYARGGFWSRYAGPAPGLFGFRAPRESLR